jgi:hypothetical protein
MPIRPAGRTPARVLTSADVREIRSQYAGGGITQNDLGLKYGVSQGTVSRIIRRAAVAA